MKLYYSPGACSMSVHIALREVGAKFDVVAVDLSTHKTADGVDYKTISPRGYVPLLQLDDGSRHTEAAALLQYVGDLDPAKGLIGAPGSERRRSVVEWLAFVSTELHKPFGWLWNKDAAESTHKTVKDKLALRFGELDALLGRQDYLAGTFSVADAYAFTVINWSRFLKLPLTATPHVEAYLDRVGARPKVHEVMVAEGLTK